MIQFYNLGKSEMDSFESVRPVLKMQISFVNKHILLTCSDFAHRKSELALLFEYLGVAKPIILCLYYS